MRGLTILVAAAALCAGCGAQSGNSGHASRVADRTPVATAGSGPAAATGSAPVAHPQAIQPTAGAVPAASASGGSTAADPAGVSVQPSGSTSSLPQPQPLAEVRRELAQSGMTASTDQAALTGGGLAVAPLGAPAPVQAVIAAGNQIAKLPYVWGGGHARYQDTGYDCSGSISYVFAAAGLLDRTVTSGELENWGDPGPGKWITVYANAGHTFMYVAGLRFDTVALAETGTRWSNRRADEPDLSSFSVRHPPGL